MMESLTKMTIVRSLPIQTKKTVTVINVVMLVTIVRMCPIIDKRTAMEMESETIVVKIATVTVREVNFKLS